MFDTKYGGLVRQINACARRLDDLVTPELSPDLVSPLLALPALRGVWVGSVASGGTWHDISGHGNHLTYNGNPTHAYDGVAPYWALDGTGDYFNITDAASGNDFDVLGTEAYVAAAYRGLTVMGWFYPEETGTGEGLITKWGAAGNRAYYLFLDATDQFNMRFSDDGTNSDTATSSAVSMSAWYFVAGRVRMAAGFVDVFVGSPTGLELTSQATARASIFNTATDFNIGATNGGTEFQGRVACAAVCAAALSTAIISSVFNQMKGAVRI